MADEGLRLADVLVPLLAGAAGMSYRNIGRGAQAALGAYDAVRTWRAQDEQRQWQQKQREMEVNNRERVAQYLRSRTAGPGTTTEAEDAAQASLNVPAAIRENELQQEKGLLSPELAQALQGIDLNSALSFAEGLRQKSAARQMQPATPQAALAQIGSLPQGAEASMETRGGVKVKAEGQPFFKPDKPVDRAPVQIHDTYGGKVTFVDPDSVKSGTVFKTTIPPRENPADKSPTATLGNLMIRKLGKKSVKELTPDEAGAVADALMKAQMSPTDQFFSELLAKRKGGGAAAPAAKTPAGKPKGKPRTAEELLGQ